MMDKKLFAPQKGFGAMREEEDRRKKEAARRSTKLWRFFIGKDEKGAIPLLFLTEEPVMFWEHTDSDGKNPRYCQGEGCEDCTYAKPRYMGAWLVVDRKPYTYEDKKTGEMKTVKDRIKLMVRGMTTGAQLERLSTNYGLTKYQWEVTKTGTGKNTVWNFDRKVIDDVVQKVNLSEKELEALRQQLPEKLRGLSWDEIVMEQILPSEDDDSAEATQESIDAIRQGVQQLEDDAEETPKAPRKVFKRQ